VYIYANIMLSVGSCIVDTCFVNGETCIINELVLESFVFY